ncbi:MAG: MarR family transcriptional regulator [Anaerolineaceae bacterium]
MGSDRMAFYESLKAIFLHIDNHEKAFLSQYSLSLPRFYALLHISNHPGINYIDLSDLMLCTKSNTTRIVQGMQKDHLVDRKNHPADGRSYQLYLTETGASLYECVYPEYVNLVDQLMSLFTDDELTTYAMVSQHIESTLDPKSGSLPTRLNTTAKAVPVEI